MMPRTCRALAGALTLLLPLAAPAQNPAAKASLTANAALQYYQGFQLLAALGKDQTKIIKAWDRVPLDDAALQVIQGGDQTLTYLHRGARLPGCEWGLDRHDGPFLLLPYLEPALTTARLAGLRARVRFDRAMRAEGVDDLLAALALARHVGADAIPICLLVEYRMEKDAIEALAGQLPKLDAATLKSLAARLEKLPPAGTMRQAMGAAEKKYLVGWLVQRLKAIDPTKKGWEDEILRLFVWEPKARAILNAAGHPTPAKMVAVFQKLDGFYDELAKLPARPWNEVEGKVTALTRKARAANPLGDLVLPNAARLFAAEGRAVTRLALLKAAVAVVRGGPDQVKGSSEPYGKGPFAYRVLPKGFELRSHVSFQGQPVTLTVGPPR